MTKNEIKELRKKIVRLSDSISIDIPEKERRDYDNYWLIPVALLVNADWNYKNDEEKQDKNLEKSITRQGQVENLNVREMADGRFQVGNGNHRNTVFHRLGREFAVCYVHKGITEAE